MKKLILPAFALMILAQWIVPGKMIFDSEAVLSTGTTFNFKTRPIDPSDPFRGKYVILSFQENSFQTDTLYMYEQDEVAYAQLQTDEDGFARIISLAPEMPTVIDDNFLKVKIAYAYKNQDKQDVTLDFSFNRFYVEESKASQTEQVYWNAQRDTTQIAYAVVKIRNGQGIVNDVMINGRPILEIVRELNEKESVK